MDGRDGRKAASRRAERLREEIERIRGLLAGRADVERVILFGSAARGSIDGRSDIDLIIVQTTDRRFLDRLDEMYRFLQPRVACDILVYTREEFERLRTESSLVERAAREGVVLHAA